MSATDTPTPASSAALPDPDPSYKWKAFTAIGISFFTQVMSMSMVFVALSSIADDYGVTLRAVTWVVIAEEGGQGPTEEDLVLPDCGKSKAMEVALC